ncbi:class I SAM-dependent methyltransferase [Leptospira sp. WS92.C1]
MLKKKPYSGFSSVYDAVMQDVRYSHWAKFILASYKVHSQKKLPRKVLDLGCGTCKLWKEFPESVEFTGIDSSLEMLEIARKKSIQGELIHSNLLNFNLYPQKFDLILSTHDTLNYLQNAEELKQTFQRTRAHLEVNGLFFFDLSSLFNFKAHFDGQTFYENTGDYKIRWENRFLEEFNSLESVLIFSHKVTKEEFYEVHRHRYFPQKTIHSLLKETGLELLEEGSDYKNWNLKENASFVNYLCRGSEINLRTP